MCIRDSDKYDLAGFCVGVKSGEVKATPKLKENDIIVGISSSGLHSNGYSLVRKIIKKNIYSQNTILSKLTLMESGQRNLIHTLMAMQTE